MVNVAQFVKRKLDETNAIEEAMLRRDGYGLVITGNHNVQGILCWLIIYLLKES